MIIFEQSRVRATEKNATDRSEVRSSQIEIISVPKEKRKVY